MREQKWVITGVNRLMGEREVVSNPHRRQATEDMLRRMKQRQNSKSAYSLLRMKPADEEGRLW